MGRGLVIAAAVAAGPAAAEVAREECLALVFQAEQNRLVEQQTSQEMRRLVFEMTETAEEDERFTGALSALGPFQAGQYPSVWEQVSIAFGDLCRDKF